MTRAFYPAFVASLLGSFVCSGLASAQPTDPAPGSSEPAAGEPAAPPPGDAPPSTSPPPPTEKQQGKGDFDAGGKVRFPSGPDENNEFGSFNWVALDLYGRYFILDQVTVTGAIPLAPLKPDPPMGTPEEFHPSVFGGFTVRPELALGKTLGVGLSLGFLREGASLLSEKDFPLYIGDLTFATSVGPWVKIKGFGLDFALQPSISYQAAGDALDESITALQLPVAASLSLSTLLKVAVEAGVYTGDGFSLGAKGGGRISLGAAVDIRISKLIFHLGAGVASLLVSDDADTMDEPNDALYGSIGDSIYFDLNVKFAK